jgi:2-polyprenyl-3-methyl-5-hydroxy-6-metoxy-1,4-benzoquinol methylase
MVEPDKAGDQQVVAGNVTDKYGTKNPLYRRLMANFLQTVRELVGRTNAKTVHEIGCGEGLLAIELARWLPGAQVAGSDLSAEIVEEARGNAREVGVDVRFFPAGVQDLNAPEHRADLVVCCEVLEHLPDPNAGLGVLARLACPHLLVSVPREPLWRVLNMARGKYLRQWGNTPGHVQHWSRRGFVELLKTRVRVVEVRSPLPWTMALCRADED